MVDQSMIQGNFLLSSLWRRVLFNSGASHSFITASRVKDLGLEVETFTIGTCLFHNCLISRSRIAFGSSSKVKSSCTCIS